MSCGKETFPSRHSARKAVARRKRFGNKRYRQYFCEACHGFHNTTEKQVGKVDKGRDWDDS